MSATSPVVARSSEPDGHSAADPWRPAASRIVLRKAKRNRRLPSPQRFPPVKQIIDACGRAMRRGAPALIGLVLVAGFGGAAALSHRWVTTSPRFAIQSIEIRGNRMVAAEAISELLPVQVGDNMFASDTRSIERSLDGNPWIANAEVHRELPRTIVVTVRERRAVALVDLGALYLVDAMGVPFKRTALESGEGDGLPVITGIERLAFRADPVATSRLIGAGLAAVSQWRSSPTRPAIAEVNFDTYRGLAIRTLVPAIAVHLGSLDDPALLERMTMFETAWRELSSDEQARTETIYLDADPGQATIAFAKN